jgi:hypothetical protein
MYHNPTSTENATKLPIEQDAWLLFFVLRGSGTLEILTIKPREQE